MMIFLFLDVMTLNLGIIIIILPTDQPKIILPTTVQQKIKLPPPYSYYNSILESAVSREINQNIFKWL